MTGHPDEETLALHAADPSTEFAGHIAGCARCQQKLADVVDIRRQLAALPPATMPTEVLSALEQRLRHEAEAPREAAAARRPASAAARRSRLTGRLPLAALGAAAALAAVGGGLAIAATHLGASSSASKPAMAAGRAQAQSSAPGAVPSAPTVYAATGRDYHHSTLAAGVTDLLALPRTTVAEQPGGMDAATPTASGGVPRPHALVPATAAQPGCLSALARLVPAGSPRAVDVARYDGAPALLVVVGTPVGAATGYVVAPACSSANQHILDQVSVAP